MKVRQRISSITRNAAEELLRLNRRLSDLNRSKRYSDAIKLFAGRHFSLRPDHYTLSAAAVACANLRDAVVSGAQLHALAVRTGLSAYPHVFNALLSLYAKVGDLDSVKRVFGDIENPDVYSRTTLLSACAKLGEFELARQIFDEMPNRDVAVWNAMITGCAENEAVTAMRFFSEMHRMGVKHDKYSLAGVLSLCSPEVLGFGRAIHLVVIKTGFMRTTSVCNALITMYFNCGLVSEAYRLFEEAEFIGVCDHITFNVMVDGLAKAERCEEALAMFKNMTRACLRPTQLTFVSVMSSCSDSCVASQLHGEAIKLGFEDCTAVGNSAITMYSSCGDLNAARKVFYRLEEKDLISWNSMISSYTQGNYDGESAISVYLQMQREDIRPDEFTVGSLLSSSESSDVVGMIHALVTKHGLSLRIQVSNALVSAYSKHEKMNLAYQAFEDIACKNLISWNTLISGFVSNGFPSEGLEQFSNLMISEIRPNVYTLTIVLTICANISNLRLGKQVHGFATAYGLVHETCLANALVSMYAKGGDLDWSVKVFETMIHRDTVSYNALISAYAQHGKGEEAVLCFERMQGREKEVKPNQATFTAVLSACSHTGSVHDGARIFNQMVRNYGFVPTADHLSCIVDLLARGGYLDEAQVITKGENVKAHSQIWWALLSACAAHGNVRLGRVVARILLEIEPDEPSVYVLLANIYAAAGQWEEAANVREMMSRTWTAKKPGCSWISL